MPARDTSKRKTPEDTIRIFVSYCHADMRWVVRGEDPGHEGLRYTLIPWLQEQLKNYRTEIWCDPKLKDAPFEDFAQRIQEEIALADIALPLLSEEFAGSGFIEQQELPRIKQRHDNGDIVVLSILVGPITKRGRQKIDWLFRPTVLPSDVKPLLNFLSDEAEFRAKRIEILEAIQNTIEYVQAKRIEPPPPDESFELVVNDGSGSGIYVPGKVVELRAMPAPEGQVFDIWNGARVADPRSPNTTLTIPAEDSVVTGTFKLMKPPPPEGNFAKRVEKAKNWLSEMPRDVELSGRVRSALEKATVVARGGGYSPVTIQDKDSSQVWHPLHESCKGLEVPYLCLFLMESHKDWTMPWKATTFLRYSLGTPGVEPEVSLNAFAIITAFSTSGGALAQRAALDAIAVAPVAPTLKWEGLQYAIEGSDPLYVEAMVRPFVQLGLGERRVPTRGVLLKLLGMANASCVRAVLPNVPALTAPAERSAIASILLDHLTTAQDDVVDAYTSVVSQLTPLEQREQTAPRLLEVLERVQTGNGGPVIVGILRNWNCRQAIPQLREMLEMADAGKSASLTRLLADWKDKDSTGVIRAVVERFRYYDAAAHHVNGILNDLYTLQGAGCAGYLAEVLLSASDSMQKIFLHSAYGNLCRIRDKPWTDAIRQLAESSLCVDVKTLAAEIVK